MKLSLEQEATFEQDNWWKWSVWVEANKDNLEQIEYVEYTLHPSFPQPIRRIDDRVSKFRLDSAGWGEFLIRALVAVKDGRPRRLKHWLKLEYPAEGQDQRTSTTKQIAAGGARPVLFLSCSIADMPFANALSKALLAEDIEVIMVDDQPSELPWDASINISLNRANLAVFIVSDTPNTWMTRELEASKERKLPVIPILIMTSKVSNMDLPANLEKPIQIKPVGPDQTEESANNVAKQIQDRLESIIAEPKKRKKTKTSDR